MVREALCAVHEVSAEEVIAICTSDLGEPFGEWLRRAITAMPADVLGDLLYFITAARCMPSSSSLGGTGSQLRFQHWAGATDDHLPVAHTCFNSVDMPKYSSFEKLQEKLLEAVAIGRQQGGFQMG